MHKLLELTCRIFGLGHEKESFFALLSHLLLALEQILHDLLELLLQGISLPLQQLVPFLGCSYFLLVQLHVPELLDTYMRLAVIWLISIQLR